MRPRLAGNRSAGHSQRKKCGLLWRYRSTGLCAVVSLLAGGSARANALKPDQRQAAVSTESSRVPAATSATSWPKQLQRPDIPFSWNDRVARFVAYFTKDRRGRSLMQQWLRRQRLYQAMLVAILRKHRLASSLNYVAMIESAYDPTRTSRRGASGLWQFMRKVGKSFGLRRDYWIDERRDPQKATRAAARYLKTLFARFGSWELALAAYHAGSGTIVLAMRKYNTNNFWRLCDYEAGLPWSTTLYVPKIFAAAVVGENRRHFGFAEAREVTPIAVERVPLLRQSKLHEIAATVGIDTERFERLNPQLRRKRTPPTRPSWIYLPRGSSTRFHAEFSRRYPRYQTYRLRLGDSEEQLAQRFGTTVARIRAWNGLRSTRDLRPETTILLPWRRKSREAQPNPALPLVALSPGLPTFVAGKRRIFYRMVLGDSLPRIAGHLGVSVTQLRAWNRLEIAARVVSGMVLQAFIDPSRDLNRINVMLPSGVEVQTSGSQAFLDRFEALKGRRRQIYTVRSRDTLRRIARRFGLTVADLLRINRFGPNTELQAGQVIVVYNSRRAKVRRRHARRDSRRGT